MNSDIREAVRMAALYDEIDDAVRQAKSDSMVTREIPSPMEIWRRIRWAEVGTRKPARGSKAWREIFNRIGDLLAGN